MGVSADDLTGKLRQVHDELEEGERRVYLEALGSPSVAAEKLVWALQRLGISSPPSPSLIRTFRRSMRARNENQ